MRVENFWHYLVAARVGKVMFEEPIFEIRRWSRMVDVFSLILQAQGRAHASTSRHPPPPAGCHCHLRLLWTKEANSPWKSKDLLSLELIHAVRQAKKAAKVAARPPPEAC